MLHFTHNSKITIFNVKAAFQRWRAEGKKQRKSPKLFCGEDSFIKFLLEEAKQFKEESQKFGKIDALTGVGSQYTQVLLLNDEAQLKKMQHMILSDWSCDIFDCEDKTGAALVFVGHTLLGKHGLIDIWRWFPMDP